MSAALQADDCTEPSVPCPCESVIRLAENLAHNTGWAVFPCRADKRPATEHGFLDAVSDPVLVADLWHQFPGPLIGIATGARSGFDVLDIDAGSRPDDTPKKAALRQAARAWWHVNASRIPRGRAYQTESGGIHVYFQHAPGVRNSESLIAQGIECPGRWRLRDPLVCSRPRVLRPSSTSRMAGMAVVGDDTEAGSATTSCRATWPDSG